jgi:CDP-glucose 4,6-dehydratase
MNKTPTTRALGQFQGKTVLITGHTGFKGSWLTAWLLQLGAKVIGVSIDVAGSPSHFESAQLFRNIKDLRIDIRNGLSIQNTMVEAQPDFVFHLAAQSLVRGSYADPVETWQTNVLGTLNVLEALRKLEKNCVAVMITSDKCYENVEWLWGYKETDRLGGSDPYSASKAAAELAISSHVRSYFPTESSNVRIASARAGNVIGGGDWAIDRIVPDCVRSWANLMPVTLRNPQATRPWQHVLEPLSGYLTLALSLAAEPNLHGEAFNFGPQTHENRSVADLVSEMAIHWEQVKWSQESTSSEKRHEAALLKLNCDKALQLLNWHANLTFEDTVRLTAEWYQSFYAKPKEIREVTDNQIKVFTQAARENGLLWAQ